MEFKVCHEDCPFKNGMPGFLSQGFYPSSPKQPQFAISTNILLFFHLLHMKSPSSKQGFCTAIQTYLELLKDLPENRCEVIQNRCLITLIVGPSKHIRQFSWCIPRLGKGASACQV